MRWDEVLRLTQRHRLISFVYHSLCRSDEESLPPEPARENLHRRFLFNAQRNLLLTSKLCEILKWLETAGIQVLPYKGPALAAAVYGDFSFRTFSDLDLIVPETEAPRARDLLLEKGFRHRSLLSGSRLGATLKSQNHYQLVSECGQFLLELHWAVVPPHFSLALPTTRLFERSRPLLLAGGYLARDFSPEDLFLLLCVHGGKDYWERLSWIADVAEAIRRYPRTDWPQLLREARECGAERMVLFGFHLAREFLDADLPSEIRERCESDRALPALVERATRQLFQDDDARHHPVRSALFHMAIRERVSDRFRYAARFVWVVMTPTEKEWSRLSLPEGLFFLYYFLRPVRLGLKYLLKIGKRAWR